MKKTSWLLLAIAALILSFLGFQIYQIASGDDLSDAAEWSILQSTLVSSALVSGDVIQVDKASQKYYVLVGTLQGSGKPAVVLLNPRYGEKYKQLPKGRLSIKRQEVDALIQRSQVAQSVKDELFAQASK